MPIIVQIFSLMVFNTRFKPNRRNTLSLHDALPISDSSPITYGTRADSVAIPSRTAPRDPARLTTRVLPEIPTSPRERSEEHTSELQSRFELVCRLLLVIKKQGPGHAFAKPNKQSPN